MSKLTAREIAEKHQRRLNAASEDIRRGVEGVTESPAKKAAQHLDKMKMNWLNAMDSGKIARRLNAVTVEDWRNGMIEKGIGRISAGLTRSLPKTEKFFSELMPHIDSLQSKVKGMPSLTLEDNINRMVTFVRGMSDFKRSG